MHALDLPRGRLTDAPGWLCRQLETVGPCHVVGHSMGAAVALRAAARAPEVVRRLVLLAPAGLPSGRSALGHAAPLFRAVATATPRFLPVLARDALRTGPWHLWHAAREVLGDAVR